MTKYNVWANIKFCGIIQVEADSEKEALQKAWKKDIHKTDLANMQVVHTGTDTLDILEAEECELKKK